MSGFLLAGILSIYALFPHWIGFVITSQLPEDMILNSYEINYPRMNDVVVPKLSISINGFNLQLEDVKLDYGLKVLDMGKMIIETRQDSDSAFQLRLPIIENDDLEFLENFNKVSIKKLQFERQANRINVNDVVFTKNPELQNTNKYRLVFSELNIYKDNAPAFLLLKGSINFEVIDNQYKLDITRFQNKHEQPLLSLDYQLNTQQVTLFSTINYQNLKSLFPQVALKIPLEPSGPLSLQWVQNHIDNKLQLLMSSGLNVARLDNTTASPLEVKVSLTSDSNNFPLAVKADINIIGEDITSFRLGSVVAEFSALKLNSNFLLKLNSLNVNAADFSLSEQQFDFLLEKIHFTENDKSLNLQADTLNVIGKISDFSLSAENLSKENVTGQGQILINQQLLAPFSFTFDKILSDLSIRLQRNKLAIQLINYFLKPFSKDSNIPIEITEGEVVHSAEVVLSKDVIVESIFNIKDMSFNFGKNNIYGLNLSQKLTSISPLKLHSNLTIESINFSSGIEITNLIATIEKVHKDSFETTTFSGELLGGKLFSKAIKFNADGIEKSTLELQKISLTDLIYFFEVPGLYGDGTMNFSLPITLKGGVVTVTDGTFKALDKGIIKYNYTDSEPEEDENIALKALRNFHYDSLDGTFSYNEQGLYHIKLHLLGSNPELYDGYPVDFILNLNGELSGVFRSLFLTGSFEEAIMEQVKASQLEQ